MRSKILSLVAVFFAVFVSNNAFAEEKKASPENTIPFMTYNTTFMATSTQTTQSSNQTSNQLDVPTKTLGDFIKRTRASICQSVGDADVKIWISVDVNAKVEAKILAIGSATQSGLEVTFHCKGK